MRRSARPLLHGALLPPLPLLAPAPLLTPPRRPPLSHSQLLCKWRDQQLKACEVIERKQNEDTGEWQYYVHYEGLNRRLDEWVTLDRFDLGHVNEEGKLTRTSKRKYDHEEHEEEGELDLATLKEHEEATKVKNINRVVMGQWQMETWYFSPFGKEYDGTDVLYVCEFDLNFFARREQLERYLCTKCKYFHPPGDEIYREKTATNSVSIFEVDPKDHRIYCENLCLLAKLFLDHKTLWAATLANRPRASETETDTTAHTLTPRPPLARLNSCPSTCLSSCSSRPALLIITLTVTTTSNRSSSTLFARWTMPARTW